MRRSIALTIGTLLFITMRVTNTDVPIFSMIWWLWLIGTVLIAGATGWVYCLVYHQKKGRL